ncbi:ABC transporter substrate-binding protein [Paenibacillus sp. ACRRY]|uniref:ABC transporter substrate-binding protein n=1 Tax=Paenibacillus sp. ACRRY TaxID=2918208 RepID=UPI001EF747D4|nr:ABC transporter substrate-binding protein [Paenibacillus sp. ACRRY]MCG7384594.1 ABC transporter substrate-binding protein [Paenibacillus sp. ACRRY]
MVKSIRNMPKWSVALTLSLSLLAGCSSEGSTNGSSSGDETAPVTFTFFGADANPNWSNMQDDVGKEITKQTGVTLNAEFAMSDPSQRLALIAASGDYPDLISPKGDLDKLIDAGAMLDLTDLIEEHAPNLKKLFGDEMKRLRYSNDDPSIYVIPTYSAIDGVNFVAGGGFQLQHRAVKEAGYPEIKTLQDYENVIRNYLEKHPTDENGNPNIGMTLNADDWHIQITVTNQAAETTGKSGDGEYYIDPETYEASYHFRTEGEKEYFQWLNHMYNTGLLDKESFVQKNDQYLSKVASGRVIGLTDVDWGYADGEKALKAAGKNDQTYGHYSVMLSDQYKDNRYQSTGFMAGWGVGITVDCEDPVRAIKFLDYLASEEAQVLNNWGIEGKHYEVKDGTRVVPSEVQERIVNDNIAFSRESGVGFYTNLGAHYGDGAKDSTGNYYTKNFPEQIVENYTDADKETLKAYGATTWMDLFPNEKDFPAKPWGAVWNISVPSEDEINIISSKVKDITWKQIPQAIMAKPEDFETIWNDYQQMLINAGVEKMEQGFTKYVQDRVKLWNE